jgi:hypothetical protein
VANEQLVKVFRAPNFHTTMLQLEMMWCRPINLQKMRKILNIPDDRWRGRRISFYLQSGKKEVFWVWQHENQVIIYLIRHQDDQFREMDQNLRMVYQIIRNAAITTWFQDYKFMEQICNMTHCTWAFNMEWFPKDFTLFCQRWMGMIPRFEILNQTLRYQENQYKKAQKTPGVMNNLKELIDDNLRRRRELVVEVIKASGITAIIYIDSKFSRPGLFLDGHLLPHADFTVEKCHLICSPRQPSNQGQVIALHESIWSDDLWTYILR